MNAAMSLVASYAVNALWQVPLLAAAGWVLARMLRRMGPEAEHRLWVAVLGLAVLLPAVPGSAVGIGRRDSGGAASVRVVAEGDSGGVAASASGRFDLAPAAIEAIAGLYLLTVLVRGLRLGLLMGAARRLVRGARVLDLDLDLDLDLNADFDLDFDAAYRAVWAAMRGNERLGPVRLLESAGAHAPLTLGLGVPLLILPEGFTGRVAPAEFRAALSHEAAHIQRRDFGKNLGYEMAALLIGFHPVSWWIQAQIAGTREMVCDAMAAEAVGGQRVYVSSLLRLASEMACGRAVPTSNAIGIFDANILERRVMMLRAKKRETSVVVRCGLGLAGACLLTAVAVGGATKAVALVPARAAGGGMDAKDRADQADQKVYRIGKDVTAPKLLFAPNPEYPASERKDKKPFQGTCLVGLVVNAAGQPSDVRILRSLSKDFDENALKSVQRYRFSPAQKDGKPVAVELRVEVRFAMY